MPSLHTVISILAASTLLAQDASTPTIRVTTRLVQISVLAHDKRGEPVADLKKEDFTVYEKGKEQQIAVFSADLGASQPTPAAKLPANIFSNRLDHSATPASTTVILFDGLNTTFADQARARAELIKFVSQIQPGDQVALYTLNRSNVRVLHDFTDDPERLTRSLAKYRASHSAALDASEPDSSLSTGNDVIDQLMSSGDKKVADFYIEDRARWTLEAMEGIAHHMAAIPGRKNLVWVSGGFPVTLGLEPEDFGSTGTHRTFYEETTRTARAMSDANIAIYPVDARGLIADPSFSATSRQSGTTRTAPVPKLFTPANHDTMLLLAERTGGRAFYNRNDIDGAVRSAVNDAKVTYTLGFYSPESDWDGKFHDLKVKVNRPGVEVRYRKGFVAVADPAPSAKDLRAEVTSLLSNSLDATAIGINARADSDPKKPEAMTVVVQLDPTELYLSQQNDRWAGSLIVIFAQYAADGRGLNKIEQTIELNLTKPRYEDMLKRGMIFNKQLVIAPESEVLKMIVLDKTTGRIGSLKIPVKSK
jgi:VWFA-related protein